MLQKPTLQCTHHIDLFSGIGGFSYALDQVFSNVSHTFCEIDPFCQKVLAKHWPGSQIIPDIRDVTTDAVIHKYRPQPRTVRTAEKIPSVGGPAVDSRGTCRADIITGGFPCQPFSQAGKRGGTDDSRYLWPHMFRVIQEFKPTWVVAENVHGLLTLNGGMVFEQVCTDLEGEGYDVQPLILPACAVNAPHRRDRIWFIASRGMGEIQARDRWERQSRWSESWIDVATELCRVDDGVPTGLDRRQRLKALGNAIVPAVAVEIFKAIAFK
jgi:DNA (cytosine-5)-methyltransferase 1